MTEHITGENPLLLPTPVAIVHARESNLSIGARFLSWLTATILALSVLVALISVAFDRDSTRRELACRAAAAVGVNQAVTNEQIALANHSVAVGEFITLIIENDPGSVGYQDKLNQLAVKIAGIDQDLTHIGIDLQHAVDQQQEALTSC